MSEKVLNSERASELWAKTKQYVDGATGDGSVTAPKIADGAVTWDKLSSEARHSNPNLLDNWYFADPINQKRKISYTDGYTIDRWNLIGLGQVEIVDGGIKLTQASDFQIYWRYQFDPHIAKALAGKTVTLSCLSLSGSETFGPNIFSGGAWLESTGSIAGVNYKTLTLPNDLTDLFVQLGGIGNSAIIQAVKLELGPVQTLAHQDANGNWVLNDPPPNKALELLKCQRDQMVYKNQDCVGIAIGNTILIQKPCMRANPTVVQNGATLDVNGATVGLDELTIQNVNAGGAFIVATVQNMDFGYSPAFVRYDSPAPLIIDSNL